eukprot:gene9086-10054_t
MADDVDKTSKRKKSSNNERRRKKRAPPQPVRKENTVLVHRKTDFKTQLEKCQRLLDKGIEDLEIHGLGAAINQAVNIALQLQINAKGNIKLTTTTSTVNLVDDYQGIAEDIDPYSKSRLCSAIQIKLSKIDSDKLETE